MCRKEKKKDFIANCRRYGDFCPGKQSQKRQRSWSKMAIVFIWLPFVFDLAFSHSFSMTYIVNTQKLPAVPCDR